MNVLMRIVQGTGLGWVSTSSKDFTRQNSRLQDFWDSCASMIFGVLWTHLRNDLQDRVWRYHVHNGNVVFHNWNVQAASKPK